MRRYALVSTFLFTVIAIAQLTRTILGWAVIVAGAAIPLWVSGIASLITGSLALWGFRVAGRQVVGA
jgi:hypothetical protein